MRSKLALVLLLLLAGPADAILLRSGNGNSSAPPGYNDPGWAHVGKRGGLNAVYLGYGWVITAAHVGFVPGSTVELDGVEYPNVGSSRVLIRHDETHLADLQVFRIDPYPEHLGPLPIRSTTPPLGTHVMMIGRGFGRGTFNPWGPGGWDWDPDVVAKRWGTNSIGGIYGAGSEPVNAVTALIGPRRTRALVVEFNEISSVFYPHETMATMNDSGGALFTRNFNKWELAGIQFAISAIPGQPSAAAFYGNDTLSVDLAYYRDQILDHVRPCDDGRDNDGDGQVDLEDDACLWEGDLSEEPACSDGIDNDDDGQVDHPEDPGCESPTALFEYGDQDGDGVLDEEDNCLLVANPDQLDSDQDGFGNVCDLDFNGDGVVGVPDLSAYIAVFGTASGDAGYDAGIDVSGDGTIGIPDFVMFRSGFGGAPGPSGLACAGTVPCPPAPQP